MIVAGFSGFDMAAQPAQYIFTMQGLTKAYPGGKKVFENIWLSFFPDAKIGVVGVNGSGKSTLLKIMAGMDKDFTGEAFAMANTKMGYLEQEPQLDAYAQRARECRELVPREADRHALQ
jgi:ATPase subunit of ABC transporter with duplicated ATPase domains